MSAGLFDYLKRKMSPSRVPRQETKEAPAQVTSFLASAYSTQVGSVPTKKPTRMRNTNNLVEDAAAVQMSANIGPALQSNKPPQSNPQKELLRPEPSKQESTGNKLKPDSFIRVNKIGTNNTPLVPHGTDPRKKSVTLHAHSTENRQRILSNQPLDIRNSKMSHPVEPKFKHEKAALE